jgi:hypothetical protein
MKIRIFGDFQIFRVQKMLKLIFEKNTEIWQKNAQ